MTQIQKGTPGANLIDASLHQIMQMRGLSM